MKKLLRDGFLIGAMAATVVLVMVTTQGPGTSNAVEEKAAVSNKADTGPGKSVLRSSLAGTWYPADANELLKQIDGVFKQAQAKATDNVIGLILPHAGYQYSGSIAAAGSKSINREYKRVVIIGPSHRMPMEEMLSVPRVTHYATPLGEIPLDSAFINELLKHGIFQNVLYADQYEHSVQIELPLLQHRLKQFKLVPIVAGDCSLETIRKAGEILKSLVDGDTLVVASSDFVHYGPRYSYVPFTKDIPEGLKKLDMGAYDYIAKLDYPGFLQYIRRTGASICGRIPIAILLSMLDKDTKVSLVKYATSGELGGDYSNSVSYLAVNFAGAWHKQEQMKIENKGGELTGQDKKQLLALARKTIAYALEKGRAPEANDLGIEIGEAMKTPRGAFVTLKKKSQLRGCIGDIFPQRPLYKSVIGNAINAAFNDSRFSPLQANELNEITIEISALTVPMPVASAGQIRIGTDGVVLEKEGHRAVFLPQGAPEQGWGLDEMLGHLSQKAHLEADAWKSGATFLVFQAVVFGEEK